MAAKIRIRLYNVLFGDAILVTVPDAEDGKPRTRHILIDFGNKYDKTGSDDAVFEPVMKDILKQLKGKPLDLYVMTHEHMDHNQGLLHASAKLGIDVKKALKVRSVWMTGSADPDYYKTHKKAEEQDKKKKLAFAEAKKYLLATKNLTTLSKTLLAINDPRQTKDCVDFARTLNPAKTHYIHRGMKTKGKHPFEVAKFSIWAPEEDTSIYYGQFKPLAAAAGGERGTTITEKLPLPPPGVDAGAFYNLVHARMSGVVENLLAIDKANNNTSIVFCMEWKGLKLLFTGDAEERSWKEMNKQDVLEPVHFLKISHHLSHNGTPGDDLLDKLLPPGEKRYAAVSTCLHSYPGIPDKKTLNAVKKRVKRVYSTHTESKPGGWVDVIMSAL